MACRRGESSSGTSARISTFPMISLREADEFIGKEAWVAR
jgi:hypothetical protein